MMDLDRAIRQFDLEDWLVNHWGSPCGEDEWSLTCPLCFKDDKLIVNTTRRAWHCWVCQEYKTEIMNGRPRRVAIHGAGGLLDLLMLLDGMSRDEARNFVLSASRNRTEDLTNLPERGVGSWEMPATLGPSIPIIPPESWHSIEYGILPYMIERGITLDDARAFGLGWCDAGRYQNRLVFPVWEGRTLVYFQARAMWELRTGDIKSLNPGRSQGAAVSTDVLMNLDQAATHPRVVLTEGPIDAVRTGVDAVCTFGKQITGVQMAKLQRAGVKAVDLMWDADARNEMVVTAGILSGLFDTRLVYLPEGDPGDYQRDQLLAFRAQAVPFQTAQGIL